jgi:hypothetical protein
MPRQIGGDIVPSFLVRHVFHASQSKTIVKSVKRSQLQNRRAAAAADFRPLAAFCASSTFTCIV